MGAVEAFQFPATGQQVRTVMRDAEPWFVVVDVCSILGIGNPSQAVSYLDDDERGGTLITSEGGQQRPVNVVNEPGLYSLMLRSRKPEAKAFKRWVTHDVLPAIRKTGRYEAQPRHELPQTFAEALRLAADEHERAERAEQQLAITAPKAEAWDTLASAHGDYSVREAAYMLNRDQAINTGQNRLFTLLREWGLIDRNDRPYASHARHVTLRARSYRHPVTGEEQSTQQVRVTAEGLRYLHRRLGGSGSLEVAS